MDLISLTASLAAMAGRYAVLHLWANIEDVALNYQISGKVTAARELIITRPNG